MKDRIEQFISVNDIGIESIKLLNDLDETLAILSMVKYDPEKKIGKLVISDLKSEISLYNLCIFLTGLSTSGGGEKHLIISGVSFDENQNINTLEKQLTFKFISVSNWLTKRQIKNKE